MVKAIIFDWGRTLFDSENSVLFPQTKQILEMMSQRYVLAIVSLASDGNVEKRKNIVCATEIETYFQSIRFSQTDKDSLYESTLVELALNPYEVAIVDDRIIRGIKWGNTRGAATIWLRKGKFAHEEPNEDTGMPTYIIQNIGELCQLPLHEYRKNGDHKLI